MPRSTKRWRVTSTHATLSGVWKQSRVSKTNKLLPSLQSLRLKVEDVLQARPKSWSNTVRKRKASDALDLDDQAEDDVGEDSGGGYVQGSDHQTETTTADAGGNDVAKSDNPCLFCRERSTISPHHCHANQDTGSRKRRCSRELAGCQMCETQGRPCVYEASEDEDANLAPAPCDRCSKPGTPVVHVAEGMALTQEQRRTANFAQKNRMVALDASIRACRATILHDRTATNG